MSYETRAYDDEHGDPVVVEICRLREFLSASRTLATDAIRESYALTAERDALLARIDAVLRLCDEADSQVQVDDGAGMSTIATAAIRAILSPSGQVVRHGPCGCVWDDQPEHCACAHLEANLDAEVPQAWPCRPGLPVDAVAGGGAS